MDVIVQKLSVSLDRHNNLLWFRGKTIDGYEWGVGFPVGHVVLTFDQEAQAAGMAPRTVLGDVEITSMDGFWSKIKKAVSSPVKVVSHAATKAYSGTVKKLGEQAVRYGTKAARFVATPTTSALHAVGDVAHGKNVLQAARSLAATNIQHAATSARILGNVSSVVPGIGTGASFALQYSSSVTDAVARGKSLYSAARDAAIKAALNSMPGGELTGAVVRTVGAVALAGVQGKNVLKSARNELVASAVGLVPDARAQAVLKAAADAALSGHDVLRGAASGAVTAALAQIPDAAARRVVEASLRGSDAGAIVAAASPALLSHAAASVPTGGVAAVVTAVAGANPRQLQTAHASLGWAPSLDDAPADHMGISRYALSAFAAGKHAARVHAAGTQAAERMRTGQGKPGDAARVAQAAHVVRAVSSLRGQNTPHAHMMRASLRALPAHRAA
jgi:hypothetical protein